MIEHMCYYAGICKQGEAMRLLQIAVENQRWDLAAHTIILATARVLKDGDKPSASKRVSNNPLLRISGCSGTGKTREIRGKRV